MGKRDKFDYFDAFEKQTEVAVQEAELLIEAIESFTEAEHLKEVMERAHELEHKGDEINHAIFKTVATDFITPIEREDIIQLSQNIDEMTDKIEDVMLRIYCNNIREIRPDALTLVGLTINCCEETKKMITEFANFKHSKSLHDHIVHINTMEEEADRLFISSMHTLHVTCGDPIAVITWREIYIYLEKCVDACEHVADAVEGVVMKNS